jgi:putative endonuclease
MSPNAFKSSIIWFDGIAFGAQNKLKMAQYVYILRSSSSNIFYVGETSDVEQRLIHHNASDSSFSSKHIPWELVWFTEGSDRSEVLVLKKKLKKLLGIRKQEFIKKHS